MKRVHLLGICAVAVPVVGAVGYACWPDPGVGVHFNAVVDFGAPPPKMAVYELSEHPHRPVPGNYDDYQDDGFEAKMAAKKQAAIAIEAHGGGRKAITAYQGVLNLARVSSPSNDGYFSSLEMLRDAEFWKLRIETARSKSFGAFVKAYPPTDSKKKPDVAALRALRNSDIGAQARFAVAQISANSSANPAVDAAAFESAAIKGTPRRAPALIGAATAFVGRGSSNPTPKQIEWARRNLKMLLAESPNSEYRWDAVGWLGRTYFLQRDYVSAMAVYLRQLDESQSYWRQVNVIGSIRIVFGKLSPADAKRVRAMIMLDPSLLRPYLDYRLYHGDQKEMPYLADFAAHVLARSSGTKLRGETLARLAEISYLTKRYTAARDFADRSLKLKHGRTDLATYVKAAWLRRNARYRESINVLKAFDGPLKSSYLAKSALELRALSHESRNEWPEALAIYHRLDYKPDVAYIADIRMPIQDFDRAIGLASDREFRQLLTYSKGVRLLRANRLAEAEVAFRRVPKKTLHDYWSGAHSDEWRFNFSHGQQDPLKTVRDLRRLETDKSPEGKYALASYYYNHHDLLLYNAPLWTCGRSVYLGFWFNETIASKRDDAAMRAHHYDHECFAVARNLCREIVRDCPKSSIVPKAMYTAALSAERLSNFNPWWRKEDSAAKLGLEACNTMAAIAKQFPNHPLAKPAAKYAGVFREQIQSRDRQALFGGANKLSMQ